MADQVASFASYLGLLGDGEQVTSQTSYIAMLNPQEEVTSLTVYLALLEELNTGRRRSRVNQ